MSRQQLFHPIFFLFSLLLFFFLSFFGNVSAAELQDGANSPSSIHATLSTMSDEQVRQLLIKELQEDAFIESQSFSFKPELTGPGAPLAMLLNELNDEAGQSENQLRILLTGASNLLPDLYKVFVSL